MIFYGLNVAAFKIPFPNLSDVWEDIRDECFRLEEADCFLPHNMQTGKDTWRTASIKGALGNWRLTDPAFYRHLPEMKSVSGPNIEDRLQYIDRWAYTELATFCPATTKFCQEVEGAGAFMNGARFLKLEPSAAIRYHYDNNPHKEFRVTLGLSGLSEETFVLNTGPNKWEPIPMKEGEAWFVDISLGHCVYNMGKTDRYRLGLQYYSPTSDWMLEMFKQSEHVVYAEQLRINPPFQEGPI
ncbi:hypothetical protein AMJ86_07830 [bacterium SM23_57]|nr:MAG: hypothetical protein AMJ86_07830 [bacterium SM23_57]